MVRPIGVWNRDVADTRFSHAPNQTIEARMIQSDDGYGGRNYSYNFKTSSGGFRTYHVHYAGREGFKVSTIRDKATDTNLYKNGKDSIRDMICHLGDGYPKTRVFLVQIKAANAAWIEKNGLARS